MIVSAAIRFDGKVFVGKTHSDVIYDMMKVFDLLDATDGEYGFLTDELQFVDRVEAAKIAYAEGQIDVKMDVLYSDLLWAEMQRKQKVKRGNDYDRSTDRPES